MKTRRMTLAAAAGLGSLAAVGAANAEETDTSVDAVVVGAGFAGLSAARTFLEAGRSVAILEAQSRPGGRAWTEIDANGAPIDRGAQALNEDMTTMLALARRHGARLIDLRSSGRAIGLLTCADSKASANAMKRAEAALAQFYDRRRMGRFRQYASLGAAVNAFGLDDDAQRLLRSSLTELFSLPPEAVSFPHVLSIVERYRSERDDWRWRTDMGLGEIARREAATFGERLKLGQPVRAVSQSAKGVVVTAEALTVNAGVAVIAVPPTSAQNIEFDGGLSSDQVEALSAFEGGTFIKGQATYTTPFWRRKGLSGSIVDGEIEGLVVVGHGNASYGVLTLFIGGPTASSMALLSQEERRYRVLSRVALALGPEAMEGIYDDTLWMPGPWNSGGYNAYVRTNGRADAHLVLAEPFGRCAFATTEVSLRFAGFTEGACNAGRVAATRLMRAF